MAGTRVVVALLGAAVAASAASIALDLDVAVPSGTPLEWKSALPQRYVGPETPFSLTRSSDGGRYAAPRVRPVVRGIGVQRPQEILTLDFAGHLGLEPRDTTKNPTGSATNERPYPPPDDVDLYWSTTVSLLQLLLHPKRVLRLEIEGRLLTLGEGALPGLEAAVSLGELADDVRALRATIGRAPPHPPDPIWVVDSMAAMMQRFVAQELCVARPYADDFEFAQRLLLLRDEIVPYVTPYLESDHSLARRNAAALLSMVDTPPATAALAQLLSTSKDPVVRLRAIHGLERQLARVASPALRAALAGDCDAIEAAALIRALGELGDVEAVPLLLVKEGPAAARGELLIERLAALVRIGPTPKRSAVEAFVAPWIDVGGAQAAWLDRRDPRPPEPADSPDPDDLRTRTVEQLARLVRARIAPDDSARQARALAPLLQAAPAGGRLDRYSCESLGGVAPLNRFVFVDALGSLGSDGIEQLKRVVRDVTCEPELRGEALQSLPMPDRLDVAAGVALDAGIGMPLRLAALELLDSFADLRAVPAAEELGGVVGLALRNRDDPVEHWRLLITVQALGRRNRLKSDELVALLRDATPRPSPSADPWLRQAESFVDGALRIGRKVEELRALARTTLLGLAPGVGFGPPALMGLDAEVAWLVGQVDAVLDRPRSEPVRAAAIRSIASFLEVFAARNSPIGSVRVDAFGQVPLLETILMELARKADEPAIDALADVLRDRSHPARAIAAIALGATRRTSAAPPLLYALKDEEPFVRLCAWFGLKRLTGQEFFVDWLAGNAHDLEKGFQEWGGWLARHGR